jgi:hypothetical protein
MNTRLQEIIETKDLKTKTDKLLAYCESLLLRYRTDEIRHAHEEIIRLLESTPNADREIEIVSRYRKEFAAQALASLQFGPEIRRMGFWEFLSSLESILLVHYDENSDVKRLLWALAEQEENHPHWKALQSAIADGVDEDLSYNHTAHEFARLQATAGWHHHHVPGIFRASLN